MSIELRPAGESDAEFVYQTKKAALGPFVESRWGWHEDYQRGIHDHSWQHKPWTLILLDGEPIGTVSIDRRQPAVQLGEFYMAPQFQDQGYGSQALVKILYQCDSAGRDCKVSVLKGNRAEALFLRHGFRVIEHDECHSRLIRNPRVP